MPPPAAPRPELTAKNTSAEINATLARYETVQLGLYQVTFADKGIQSISLPGKDQIDRIRSFVSMFPHARRFLTEIYHLGPRLLLTLGIVDFMRACFPGVRLYIINLLLRAIEQGAISGKIDLTSVRNALVALVAATIGNSLLNRVKLRLEPTLETRTSLHFELLSIKAALSRPLAASDTNNENRFMQEQLHAWRVFKRLTYFLIMLVQCISESIFLLQLALTSNLGSTFLLLGATRIFPILEDRLEEFYTRGSVMVANNLEYLRLRALKKLALSEEYHQEVLAGNLARWIIQGYEHARLVLGDAQSSHPADALAQLANPFRDIARDLIEDWSTLYYGACALLGHTQFSFATIASIQTTTTSLHSKFLYLFGTTQGSILSTLARIKDLYTSLEITPDPSENAASYPDVVHSDPKGMSLELRNVTFHYPGSQSSHPAISNVSCAIKPGQLVVIVGANGSGKTSLVKLLNRLYDPSSGSIFIDGHEAPSYKLSDIRKATALLSQDHALFPLSILENIGLGNPEGEFDEETVRSAAVKGGAARFVEKLDERYNTILHPVQTKSCISLSPGHPLRDVFAKMEAKSNVSGGERQRLVASRTFMRITSGDTRLVVVDEPSSAMDPAGEYDLFKHLREARAGKTMIFITHRFGHLTKHADVILCMKEGLVIEQGTHDELLALGGEYSSLYNVQAQAFSTM